jgi:hypothetical protein
VKFIKNMGFKDLGFEDVSTKSRKKGNAWK